MKTPQHPAGPAFDKAADAAEAWRQQQIAALTETQRRLYDEARRKAEQKEKAKAKELAQRRQADIQERMRRKLQEERNLQFNFRGRRTRMTEIVARRLIEEHFQPGRPPDHSLFAAMLQRLERTARAEVERDHALHLRAFQDREIAKRDRLLLRFERAREDKGQGRQDFARAGVKGKAKADLEKAGGSKVIPKSDAIARAIAKVQQKEKTKGEFEKAARGDGTRPEPVKSDAIARAIAKIETKEDEKRQHGDRGQGRERLTDTFDKVR